MSNVEDINKYRRLQDGGNGNGGSRLGERVASLETEIKHLATKNDIEKMKLWLLWGVIIGIGVASTVVANFVRIFDWVLRFINIPQP